MHFLANPKHDRKTLDVIHTKLLWFCTCVFVNLVSLFLSTRTCCLTCEGLRLCRAVFLAEQSRATRAPEMLTPGAFKAVFSDRGNQSGSLYFHPGFPFLPGQRTWVSASAWNWGSTKPSWSQAISVAPPLAPDLDGSHSAGPRVDFLGWFPAWPRAALSTVNFAPCQKDTRFQSVGPGFPMGNERLRTWRNAGKGRTRGLKGGKSESWPWPFFSVTLSFRSIYWQGTRQ